MVVVVVVTAATAVPAESQLLGSRCRVTVVELVVVLVPRRAWWYVPFGGVLRVLGCYGDGPAVVFRTDKQSVDTQRKCAVSPVVGWHKACQVLCVPLDQFVAMM